MNDDFTSDALQYLLDEMEPARRTAFGHRLASDPVAAAAFKTCADSLAQFAIEAAPPASLSESESDASLAGILAATAAATTPAPRSIVHRFPQWAWPAAAAVLLLLNVIQGVRLFRPGAAASIDPASSSAHSSATLENGTGVTPPAAPYLASSTTDASNAPTHARSPGDGLGIETTDPSNSKDPLAGDASKIDDLRREYARIQQARESLANEYKLAMEKLARRALTEQGVGRLATMELVDVDSYARGDRRGLMNLARGLLTEQGIVSAEPPGMSRTPGQAVSSDDSPKIAFTDTTPSFTFQSIGVGDTTAGRPGDLGFASQPSAATYAWSVYDEKQSQGYLNLYNLPRIGEAERLQVWVKPVDASDFRPVGEVPATLSGKSGSFQYQLPPTVPAPSEILITLEPRSAVPPAKPTGKVVLRGP